MPELNGDHPATRADLHALEEKLERRLQEQFKETKDQIVITVKAMMTEALAKQTETLQEFVRDTQTQLLHGFQAYTVGFDTRIAKATAELSILDAATERRLVMLERRMLEIELRVPPMPPSPPAASL